MGRKYVVVAKGPRGYTETSVPLTKLKTKKLIYVSRKG